MATRGTPLIPHPFHEEDPSVLLKMLIRLGKYLDEPCPSGIFPEPSKEDLNEIAEGKELQTWSRSPWPLFTGYCLTIDS